MTKTELNLLKTKIDAYIALNYVQPEPEISYLLDMEARYDAEPIAKEPRKRRPMAKEHELCCVSISLPPKEKTFQEEMFEWLDKKNISDVEFYKRAHIDRKLFSKIRSNVDYKPTMTTAVCVALALKLDIKETTKLLSRASLTLSPSKNWDLIITYCIENGMYNINEINQILYEYNESLLYL